MKPVLSLLALAIVLAAACGNRVEPPGQARGGSSGEAGSEDPGTPGAGARFGGSDCRACQAEACATPEADCASEPSCAAFLDCVDDCPVADDGGVERDCAADCDAPARASLAILARAVTTCREQGHGFSCECGDKPITIDLLKQECAESAETNLCYKCEDERCCDTYSECKADAECDAYIKCLQACTLDSFGDCETECGDQHPTGWEKGLRRTTCVFARCPDGDECGNGPLDPCVRCSNDRCLAEYTACHTDIACTRVDACAAKCQTPECYDACYALDAPGAELFQSYIGCAVARCASECG